MKISKLGILQAIASIVGMVSPSNKNDLISKDPLSAGGFKGVSKKNKNKRDFSGREKHDFICRSTQPGYGQFRSRQTGEIKTVKISAANLSSSAKKYFGLAPV